ncbi:CPBP family intramembrane glutamic endopeptidase [Halobacillus halophilus]|uniref:CPBP family intramembrane glutamic endopeptidase n=1 Tax=Halobacillus halophilus TaxID=1570 RepID=UPI001CD5B993|nr:type II CAAX endopeptidase family protein [Halobacillus halophilus]MCA1011689.1 CPBP family intramembrane metalloprotease [Halobacillus halophilus]
MNQKKIGFINVKLWPIIPFVLVWEISYALFSIGFNSSELTSDIADIALYIFIFLWMYLELSKRGMRFSKLSTKNDVKIPLIRMLSFVPLVKITAAALFMTLGVSILFAYPDIGDVPLADQRLQNQALPSNILLRITLAGVLAPVIEELFFRGMMLNKFVIKYGRIKGLVFTAILFTIGHPFSFFSAFLMSILFSIAYLKTGKIYVPIILHSFGNLLALMNELYLSPILMGSEETQSLPTQMDLIVIGIIAATLLFATVIGLIKLYPREKGIPSSTQGEFFLDN